MELSGRDRDLLERLEEELWRPETRFDNRRMSEVIAPDFLEFGRSGRIYKREDFEARLLDRDVAQVTYNSAVTYGGVVQRARRSSIWSRTPNGWVRRFHQGTPYDA